MSISSMSIFAAADFHEIVPPLDYSLIPTWAVFVGTFLALAIVGLIAWLIRRSRAQVLPAKSARERALEELERIADEIEQSNPYQFSIRVSDILRSYVTEQYNLPVTRQTSVEFLEGLTKISPFSGEERSLLEDFLNRCDL